MRKRRRKEDHSIILLSDELLASYPKLAPCVDCSEIAERLGAYYCCMNPKCGSILVVTTPRREEEPK